MTILSVVPGIGSALIWVPGVVYLYLTGQTLPATLLLIWCAAIVGTIDNILRPTLVGKDAKIPDLLILIGTLGGFISFRPDRLHRRPDRVRLVPHRLDIYGATFKDILPPVKSLETGKLKRPRGSLEEKTTARD